MHQLQERQAASCRKEVSSLDRASRILMNPAIEPQNHPV
jgi:hypothetical protein